LPEVFIQKNGDDFTVTTNDEHIPHLRISNVYKDLMSTGENNSEVKNYIREKILADVPKSYACRWCRLFDENFPARIFSLDVIFDFELFSPVDIKSFIDVADAQMRNVFVVGRDGKIIAVFWIKNFRKT